MHGMLGAQTEEAGIKGRNRQRETPGQRCQFLDFVEVASETGCDDERICRLGEPAGQAVDITRIGIRALWRRTRCLQGNPGFDRGCEWLARQGQIDRAARRCIHDLERAIDNVSDLRGFTQFIVPFHPFAQHAALVKHFLRPLDVATARAGETAFGHGRTPGAEQDRHVVAAGIRDGIDRIRGTDADMNHDCLGAAGGEKIAVRHGDSGIFMRYEDRGRIGSLFCQCLAIGFDDGRKIRAGVEKQFVDTVPPKGCQKYFGRNVRDSVIRFATRLL